MCRKLIYLIPFVLALIAANSVQAEPFSLGAADDAYIGKDLDVGLNENTNLPELQIHNVEGSRRVTLISYNISELQGGRKFIANASFSTYGQDAGAVNVYGVIEDLDHNIDETTITWNTAPGVYKSSRNPAIGAPVELVMTDLTDVLLTFTTPEAGVRAPSGTSQALDDFLNSDTDGIVTFLFAPAEEGTKATIRSKEHESGGTLLEGQVITPKGFNIIWIGDAHDAANPGTPDDQGWVNLLVFNGYAVDYQKNVPGTGPWQGDLTAEKIQALNSADLVIISRDAGTAGHNFPSAWNSIEVPMISLNNYMVRSNRWQWVNSEAIDARQSYYDLKADDPEHPIFAGVQLDENGQVVWLDAAAGSGNASFFGTNDVGNGHLIASRPDNGNLLIVEWEAGTPFYEGTDQVPAAKRMLFCAANQEVSGTNAFFGAYNLSAEGEKMFLNAVAYMLGISELEPINPGKNGLIAAYSFENDTNDSSGNNFHGTVAGDPVFVEGPAGYGMALDFDGDGDYVDCGNDPAFSVTDAISISVWINMRAIAGDWRAIIAKGDSAWRISTNASTQGMHFGFTGSSRNYQRVDSATQIPFNEWHHICATYDITVGGHIYIDGIEDGENPDTLGITTNNSNLYIGNNSDNPDRFWDGLIDEVAIYNRAVSEAEVLYLAGKRATPVDPGTKELVAYYPLENDVLDASGNGNDGTISGDPTYVEGPAGYGMAMEFDGDDHVDTGNTQDLATWTIACWAKSPAAPSADAPSGPVHREKNYQFNWNHSQDAFRGSVTVSAGGWHAAKYGEVEANTWYHLAGTYDGEVLKAYKDGELITTNDAPSGNPAAETGTLKLGRHATAAQFFTGTVDEAIIYNRVLSAGEIRYLAGFRPMVDPGTEGLVAAYEFQTDATDSSGNGYDGTLLGDAHVADGVLVLDGDNDAVEIPRIGGATATFSQLTYSMKVYPTVDVVPLQFSGGLNTNGWSSGAVHIKLNYGNINVGINGLAGGDLVGTTVVLPDMWSHLALTVSETEVALYLNGVLEDSRALAAPLANLIVGGGVLGAWNNGGDIQREMTGMMDDVLIYDRALSAAEILYLASNK